MGLQTVKLMRSAMVGVVCGAAVMAAAQGKKHETPKWELYGGYSFFYPGGDVHGVQPGGILPIASELESSPKGLGVGVTYNFTRVLGLTVDASAHKSSGEVGLSNRIDDDGFYSLSAGPKFTLHTHHFAPFAEVLVGGHKLSPDAFHGDTRFGVMAGLGVDAKLGHHFEWRVLRADYVYSNHHVGIDASVPASTVRGVRLQSGIVYRFGGHRRDVDTVAVVAPIVEPRPVVVTTLPVVEAVAPAPVVAAPVVERHIDVAVAKRLALRSIYFPTDQPTPQNPDGGLLESQQELLAPIAADFAVALRSDPSARLRLEGHADPRSTVEHNQGLSERRVQRVKSYLVAQGVPAESIDTKADGELVEMSEAQVRAAVERNPELNEEQRAKLLKNMEIIVLASNRRVDISLSTGEVSKREYPFNAADSMTLLREAKAR